MNVPTVADLERWTRYHRQMQQDEYGLGMATLRPEGQAVAYDAWGWLREMNTRAEILLSLAAGEHA